MKSTIIGIALLFACFFPISNAQDVPQAQENCTEGEPMLGEFVGTAHRYNSMESKVRG